jgi:hypothetical protein
MTQLAAAQIRRLAFAQRAQTELARIRLILFSTAD